MYFRFYLENVKKAHQYEELIKIFLKPNEFDIVLDEKDINCSNVLGKDEVITREDTVEYHFVFSEDHNILKKEIFMALLEKTGIKPPWGIITGIRPVKLFGEIAEKHGTDEAEKLFREYYCVSLEKTKLTSDIYKYQMEHFGKTPKQSVGLYIGIPFCPTRCLYCSFTSNQVADSEIERYLEALHKEIEYVSQAMKEKRLYAESIYIGGGTPTTLNEEQLKELIEHIVDGFKTEKLKEFTVEAGRPDTVTEEKLQVIKDAGIERISINPQTMHDKTLELIGRKHTSYQIRESFDMAHKVGIKEVNADLIAGLPEETMDDFAYSLDQVIGLAPENITVHTLAIKRASKLAGIDEDYHYKQAKTAAAMLEYSYEKMNKAGYVPYYLYRQKNMAGAGENTGFCKPGSENLYNMRIMDEHQTIIALGAGGISKMYYPEENRLERVPNVSNYQIYIERIDQMIKRKEEKIFKEV